jgi:hypothetical protein
VFNLQKDVIINNIKNVMILILHLNVTIKLVQLHQVNVQLDYHVHNQIKFFAQINLVQIVSFNVKFLMNALTEYYAQINHANHL